MSYPPPQIVPQYLDLLNIKKFPPNSKLDDFISSAGKYADDAISIATSPVSSLVKWWTGKSLLQWAESYLGINPEVLKTVLSVTGSIVAYGVTKWFIGVDILCLGAGYLGYCTVNIFMSGVGDALYNIYKTVILTVPLGVAGFITYMITNNQMEAAIAGLITGVVSNIIMQRLETDSFKNYLILNRNLPDQNDTGVYDPKGKELTRLEKYKLALMCELVQNWAATNRPCAKLDDEKDYKLYAPMITEVPSLWALLTQTSPGIKFKCEKVYVFIPWKPIKYTGPVFNHAQWGFTRNGKLWDFYSDGPAFYIISKMNSNLAIDVEEGRYEEGARVFVWTHSPHKENQTFTIVNGCIAPVKALDLCLTVEGTTNGALIKLRKNVGSMNQLFITNGKNGIKLFEKDRALDIFGGVNKDGATLDGFAWNGGVNQQWEIRVSDYYFPPADQKIISANNKLAEASTFKTTSQQFYIVSLLNNKLALEVQGADNFFSGTGTAYVEGLKIIINTFDKSKSNQRFAIMPSGVVVPFLGGNLGVTVDSISNGSSISLRKIDGSKYQKWSTNDKNGIVLATVDRAIDITGYDEKPGSRVSAYTFNGGKNQQWKIIPAI